MKKILIVEDDKALATALSSALESEGFKVISACDGAEGFRLALKEKLEVVILDLNLPLLSGFEICKKLREKNVLTPVIMLTGQKRDESDRVLGLDLGADDYLLKPFSTRELIARINAILRRTKPPIPETEECRLKDLCINFKKQTVRKKNIDICLTAKELALLRLLVSREGEVVSRDTILNEVWGYDNFPTTRTVDTFVRNLRKKIEDDPSRPLHLITVPWSGYKFQK